jgi:hypothetical protein
MSDKEQTASEFLENKEAAMEELTKLTQSNLDRLRAFSQQNINFGSEVLTLLKLEALIETVFTDPDAKMILDYNTELKKKEFFDSVMSEIRQQQLLQGVQERASKLVIPKK